MSKRSKEMKPALADWQVTIDSMDLTAPRTQDFPQSWWVHKRGRYTFHDERGVLAELAAGSVLGVRRIDPRESLRALGIDVPLAEDETRQSGYELTGRRGKP